MIKKDHKFKIGETVRYTKDLFNEYKIIALSDYHSYYNYRSKIKEYILFYYRLEENYYVISNLKEDYKIIIESECYLHKGRDEVILQAEVDYFLEKSKQAEDNISYLKKQVSMLKSSLFGLSLFFVLIIMLYPLIKLIQQ